jgi:hypothetical protein
MQFAQPFVNQTLAYLALAMLARLFRYGRLNYHGSFVNLRNGRTTPIPVDPQVWARMQEKHILSRPFIMVSPS